MHEISMIFTVVSVSQPLISFLHFDKSEYPIFYHCKIFFFSAFYNSIVGGEKDDLNPRSLY